MFNLKTKVLHSVSHFKLLPVEFLPSDDYTIIFKMPKATEVICTDRIGLVGLKPLTFALPVFQGEFGHEAEIIIKKKKKILSQINLIKSDLQLANYVLYHVNNSTNHLQTLFSRIVGTIGLHIKNRLQPNRNFSMRPRHIKQLFNFCLYPRPVFIISGFGQGEKLSLPIDVVGIYPDNKVLFSLRKTSGANTFIQSQMKVILSRAPYSELNTIYSLGKNNFNSQDTAPDSYGLEGNLYYPSFTFDIMLLSIDSFEIIGAHFCYSGEIVKRSQKENKLQLAHVPWFALNSLKT